MQVAQSGVTAHHDTFTVHGVVLDVRPASPAVIGAVAGTMVVGVGNDMFSIWVSHNLWPTGREATILGCRVVLTGTCDGELSDPDTRRVADSLRVVGGPAPPIDVPRRPLN